MIPRALAKHKTPIIIFLVVIAVFLSNTQFDYRRSMDTGTVRRLMTSGDQVPNTFLPWLILYKNTVSFDSIIETIRPLEGGKFRPYFLINTENGFRTAYPIIPAFMALPIYLVPVLLNKIPEVTYHENILKVFLMGRFAASFYAALSTVLFYYILKEVSKNEKWIIIFTLFYALGTNTWSVSSRGMWQHTFAQFFISIVVLLLLKSIKNKRLIPWVGFVLGISVLARPTNIVFALLFSIYVFFKHRDMLGRYILAVVPSILFLIFYNQVTFGSPFEEGYGARDDYRWITPYSESIPGYLFSPGRSFLFISPPLALVYYAVVRLFTDRKYGGEFNTIYRYMALSFVSSLLLFSKWYTWHGANAFGYRMLVDSLPIVGLLSYVVIDKMRYKYKIVILVLMVYSILLHGNAVLNRKSRCSENHNWSFYCLSPPARKSKY